MGLAEHVFPALALGVGDMHLFPHCSGYKKSLSLKFLNNQMVPQPIT